MLRYELLAGAALACACCSTAHAQRRPDPILPRDTNVVVGARRGATIAAGSARMAERDHSVRRGMLMGALVGGVGGAIIAGVTADPNPRVMFSSREFAAGAGAVVGALAGTAVGAVVGAVRKLDDHTPSRAQARGSAR